MLQAQPTLAVGCCFSYISKCFLYALNLPDGYIYSRPNTFVRSRWKHTIFRLAAQTSLAPVYRLQQNLVMIVLILFLVLGLMLDIALAAGDRFSFAIYPKDGTNQEQIRAITADLAAVVNPAYTYTSASRYLGTFYWWAPMTLMQASLFLDTHRDSVRQCTSS